MENIVGTVVEVRFEAAKVLSVLTKYVAMGVGEQELYMIKSFCSLNFTVTT